MIRVVLPHHLRTLAGTDREVLLSVDAPATQATLLDALESAYPVLAGTVRDPQTNKRRAFIRFFAGEDDLSHQPVDAPLPPAVAAGDEAFWVVGAMAGG